MPFFLPRVVITALANFKPMNVPAIQQINPQTARLRTYFAWPIDMSNIQLVNAEITIIQLKTIVVMFRCFCDGHHFGRLSLSARWKRVVLCCAIRLSAPLSAAVARTTTKHKIPKNISIWTSFFLFFLFINKLV